jgi:L-ribulose-5-phosphate 4-epimerase
MLLETLRKEVLEANLELYRRGLAIYTFGNASGISRDDSLVVIKPSGVPYEEMSPESMVITDMEGSVVEGELRPSSDLATHLVLYRRLRTIGGVVHTHSEFATAWAQARKPIPCLGTTHADYFFGCVPVTDVLPKGDIESEYERNTGEAICRTLEGGDPGETPAVLVAGHGPFIWGKSATEAAHNAVILESVSRMAYYTFGINGNAGPISRELHQKHFLRKHGKNAYYGQAK